MKTREETVEVIRPVIVGSVPVTQLGEESDNVGTKMACQVPPHLTAAVGDVVDQQMPRRLDGAAGEHQGFTLQTRRLAAARDIFDAAGPPAIRINEYARHGRFG